MIPTLPPELIVHIHKLAEEDEPPPERLKIRSRFERVSKSWYNMIDYFTHLIIIKVADLTRLGQGLSSSRTRAALGSETRSIYFDTKEFGTEEMQGFDGLFQWLPNVHTLEVCAVKGCIDFSCDTQGTIHAGQVPFRELDQLSSLRHLIIIGGPTTPPSYKSKCTRGHLSSA